MEAQTGPSSPPAPPSAGLDRQRPVSVSPEQGIAATTTAAATAATAAAAATSAPTFTTPFGFATPRTRPGLQTTVNQNGSFEFDRVVKSGVVNKRTQKTKKWKSVYLVLRPNTLSLYRTETEDKLRHKIFLSDLTAVAPLKDPKQKRANMFGLFSPARNFHLQASSPEEAQQWISLIRQGAMIEEEEEAMFLASPGAGPPPSLGILVDPIAAAASSPLHAVDEQLVSPTERPPLPPPLLSSSPEPLGQSATALPPASQQHHHHPESSHDTAYFSDLSDTDMQQHYQKQHYQQQHYQQQHYQQQQRPRELSIISLASVGPAPPPPPLERNPRSDSVSHMHRKSSVSGPNPNPNINIETDPDRVMWQGRLLFLRSKGGVRQWKNLWAVLRPRNLIFYKDESEYTARFILPLSAILNVVDIDPVSRSKTHCLQLITEEKSYKMCAPDEESLLQCLGAFKSLLAKRKELEARMAGAGA